MDRRTALKSALLAAPAALLADTPPSNRLRGTSKPLKITRVEVLRLEPYGTKIL